MALESYALIDFAYVQSIDGTDVGEQSRFENYINAASLYANRKANRTLGAADYTVYLPSNRASRSIVLPESPVNTISTLKVDGSRQFGDDTVIEPGAYDLEESSGILYLFDRFLPGGRRTVYVEYNAGYNPVPADLQYAVYEIVRWMADKGIESIGRKSYAGPDGADIGWELTPPVSAQRVIESYWRP